MFNPHPSSPLVKALSQRPEEDNSLGLVGGSCLVVGCGLAIAGILLDTGRPDNTILISMLGMSLVGTGIVIFFGLAPLYKRVRRLERRLDAAGIAAARPGDSRPGV